MQHMHDNIPYMFHHCADPSTKELHASAFLQHRKIAKLVERTSL